MATLAAAFVLTCAIGMLDLFLPRGVPLILAYIVPIALIGFVCNRIPIVLAAAACTAVSEFTDAYVWNVREGVARDLVTVVALTAVGLYVRQFVVHEEAERIHVQALSDENAARVQAEEQLTLLIGNSALAILTMDDAGIILQANDAAERMFTGTPMATASAVGREIGTLLPSLARVITRSAQGHSMRTMMQTQGMRLDGEPFLVEVWFSNYSTSLGRRTAAMVVDVSEDIRTREESMAEQLLNNSRLAVGAMAHEMRNVVGAIQVVMQSFSLEDSPHGNANLPAMRELLSTLETMSSVQLSHVRRNAAYISLSSFLTELQVVAQAILSEDNIQFEWAVSADQPSVWADSEGLMQVFLNLLRNSRSALAHTEEPLVSIRSTATQSYVEIAVTDNGPGVSDPHKLFRPFQDTKTMSGLGLYLSRAMMNSFRGDLRYVPTDSGARFIVELEVAAA